MRRRRDASYQPSSGPYAGASLRDPSANGPLTPADGPQSETIGRSQAQECGGRILEAPASDSRPRSIDPYRSDGSTTTLLPRDGGSSPATPSEGRTSCTSGCGPLVRPEAPPSASTRTPAP